MFVAGQRAPHDAHADDVGAVVLDVGTAVTKVGCAGEDQPRNAFASVRTPRARARERQQSSCVIRLRRRREQVVAAGGGAGSAVGDAVGGAARAGVDVRRPFGVGGAGARARADGGAGLASPHRPCAGG